MSSDNGNTYDQQPAKPQARPTVTPQPQAPESSATRPRAKGSGIGTSVVAGIVIVLVIIGIAAYFLLGYGGGNSNALQAELASSSNRTVGGVVTVATQKLLSSNQFNVSYSGRIDLRLSGVALIGNLDTQFPIRLTYQKYGNDSRIYFNATGIPIIGNLTEVEVYLANGTAYSCSKSSFALGLIGSSNSSARGITCQPSYSGATLDSGINTFISDLNRNKTANSTTVTVLGPATHNGMGCVRVKMAGNLRNGNVTGNYTVGMCLSDQYNIPLNLTFQANVSELKSGYNVTAVLNETAIGKPVTQAEITTLPGNVTTGLIPVTTAYTNNYTQTTSISTTTVAPQITTTVPQGKLSSEGGVPVCNSTITTYYSGIIPHAVTFDYVLYGGGGGGSEYNDSGGYSGDSALKVTGSATFSAGSNLTVYVGGGGGGGAYGASGGGGGGGAGYYGGGGGAGSGSEDFAGSGGGGGSTAILESGRLVAASDGGAGAGTVSNPQYGGGGGTGSSGGAGGFNYYGQEYGSQGSLNAGGGGGPTYDSGSGGIGFYGGAGNLSISIGAGGGGGYGSGGGGASGYEGYGGGNGGSNGGAGSSAIGNYAGPGGSAGSTSNAGQGGAAGTAHAGGGGGNGGIAVLTWTPYGNGGCSISNA